MAHVNNIFDLAKHVSHHRKRVYFLGMKHLMRHQTTSKEQKTASKIILGLHDIEKYLFLPWLWKYYGKKGNKANARKLYTRMNKVGGYILQTVLYFFNFNKTLVEKVSKIEKIVDVIDRHCDPVALEEFDLKEKRPLTLFLERKELPFAMTIKKLWLDTFSKIL